MRSCSASDTSESFMGGVRTENAGALLPALSFFGATGSSTIVFH